MQSTAYRDGLDQPLMRMSQNFFRSSACGVEDVDGSVVTATNQDPAVFSQDYVLWKTLGRDPGRKRTLRFQGIELEEREAVASVVDSELVSSSIQRDASPVRTLSAVCMDQSRITYIGPSTTFSVLTMLPLCPFRTTLA